MIGASVIKELKKMVRKGKNKYLDSLNIYTSTDKIMTLGMNDSSLQPIIFTSFEVLLKFPDFRILLSSCYLFVLARPIRIPTIYSGAFRTQSNIYDGAFCGKR